MNVEAQQPKSQGRQPNQLQEGILEQEVPKVRKRERSTKSRPRRTSPSTREKKNRVGFLKDKADKH